LAIQFAQKGAKVALNDWNKDSLSETLDLVQHNGGEGISRHFDVSDKHAVYQFAEEVVSHFGYVDVVINNAGYALPSRSIEMTEYEQFEQLIGVNMWGVIWVLYMDPRRSYLT